MSRKPPEFQPGLILLDVLVGAFRANGTTFEAWCKRNGHSTMNVRNAALGASRSELARDLLAQAIEAAGRDFVVATYRRRIADHYEQIMRGAA